MRSLALSLVLLFATSAAFADSSSDGKVAPVLQNMSVQEFLAFHNTLDKKLDTRDYNHVSNADREAIAKAQAEIRETLNGHTDIKELDDAARLRVFNAHERVVALWDDAEDNRTICERRKKVGSHRPELVCTTVAERRNARDAAKTMRLAPNTCDGNCGAGGG